MKNHLQILALVALILFFIGICGWIWWRGLPLPIF